MSQFITILLNHFDKADRPIIVICMVGFAVLGVVYEL